MAAKVKIQMRASAQDGTTVTLVPVTGEKVVPDLAAEVTQIVLTMPARDTKYFDIVGRQYVVSIEKSGLRKA